MSILVCYLVTPGEVYLEKAQAFLRSYAQHPAGLPHDLLLVNRSGVPVYLKDTASNQARTVSQIWHENDGGWDIGSLLHVAVDYQRYDWLVWFGSHCRILADRWLSHFYGACYSAGVGAVAPTGSLESGISGRTPNPHLRTNCLMITPRLLNSLGFGPVTSRRDCYEFEHGQASLYQRLAAKHLQGLVIGADGASYSELDWQDSLTYRRQEQPNLLVADRHTDAYLAAGPPERTALARMAGWQD